MSTQVCFGRIHIEKGTCYFEQGTTEKKVAKIPLVKNDEGKLTRKAATSYLRKQLGIKDSAHAFLKGRFIAGGKGGTPQFSLASATMTATHAGILARSGVQSLLVETIGPQQVVSLLRRFGSVATATEMIKSLGFVAGNQIFVKGIQWVDPNGVIVIDIDSV